MRYFAAVCAFALLAACAKSSESRGIQPHVLRIAISDFSSLNPLLGDDQVMIGYDLLICQTLVGLDARNRLVPVLVSRVPTSANGDVSPDGRQIVYHLRRGVRFADGQELTSEDVAFTFRAILDSRNPVLSQDAYRRIVSLQTPDRHTVVVRLKRRWNAAVSEIFAQSDFAFGILPEHAFASTQLVHARWEEHAFGSGPFRVADWRRGDRVILVPNPYFSPKPHLVRIELRIMPNTISGLDSLRAGDVDVVSISASQAAALNKDPLIHVLRTPENGLFFLWLQTRKPPTNSVNVRRAIAYAVNPQTLEKTYPGYLRAASFLPPVLAPWFDPSLRPYAFDLNRARSLLRGKTIDALYIAAGDFNTAVIVQEMLRHAGIRVAIKTCEVSTCNAPDGPLRNERFTLAQFAWIGGADPEQSVIFLCSQANANGDNQGRFCDPRFEQLFADQQTTPSAKQRVRDFWAMQQIIHDAVPIIPLIYAIDFDGMNNHVTGFARNILTYPVSPESWDVR